MEPLALSAGLAAGLILIVGLPVVGGLIWAVALGIRIRREEPPTPQEEDQPRLPEGGPVVEAQERREPDELPPRPERLLPHELRTQGSHTSSNQRRRRWHPGASGSFGSGGPGHR
ncbi:hypothetical protein GCM10018793_12010 [Streptomyces sulfonofaciens]|uniref:Secreted protein n=2 Tax=Streptomyces sulfonofaciens TaxID=68272 RepID=A0A919KUW0_9ACTN|nr:hypothetical protein GCM10018793_12010 [Streptomyces sulfonofaciens]